MKIEREIVGATKNKKVLLPILNIENKNGDPPPEIEKSNGLKRQVQHQYHIDNKATNDTIELNKQQQAMTLNSENKIIPRVEFHEKVTWEPAYQRNNKANGQKNLRCFPSHCEGLGHQRGFCGRSILVNYYMDASPESGQKKLFSFGHFTIADCEIGSVIGAAAKGACRDRYQVGDLLPFDFVRSQIRSSEFPLGHFVQGLELPDKRKDVQNNTIRINFEFNRNLKGWHYGFLGSKLTRNLHHIFRVYVLEQIDATPQHPAHYKVLSLCTSPDWTLYCRRRNEDSIPNREQLNEQTRKALHECQMNFQTAKLQRNAPFVGENNINSKFISYPQQPHPSTQATCRGPNGNAAFKANYNNLNPPPPPHIVIGGSMFSHNNQQIIPLNMKDSITPQVPHLSIGQRSLSDPPPSKKVKKPRGNNPYKNNDAALLREKGLGRRYNTTPSGINPDFNNNNISGTEINYNVNGFGQSYTIPSAGSFGSFRGPNAAYNTFNTNTNEDIFKRYPRKLDSVQRLQISGRGDASLKRMNNSNNNNIFWQQQNFDHEVPNPTQALIITLEGFTIPSSELDHTPIRPMHVGSDQALAYSVVLLIKAICESSSTKYFEAPITQKTFTKDKQGLAKYLITGQQVFINKVKEYGSQKSFQTLCDDPYANLSFFTQLVKSCLNGFWKTFENPSENQQIKSNTQAAGSTTPASTASNKFTNLLSDNKFPSMLSFTPTNKGAKSRNSFILNNTDIPTLGEEKQSSQFLRKLSQKLLSLNGLGGSTTNFNFGENCESLILTKSFLGSSFRNFPSSANFNMNSSTCKMTEKNLQQQQNLEDFLQKNAAQVEEEDI